MVTAELAACLPVLVLVLAVALSAVTVVAERVRLQDAAREAARAAARGDDDAARQLARQEAPGARIALTSDGDEVSAVAVRRVPLFGGLLPAVTVSAGAVAAAEPSAVPSGGGP